MSIRRYWNNTSGPRSSLSIRSCASPTYSTTWRGSRPNSNYIIADRVAFQQAVAIQRANVDQAGLEQHVGTAQLALHSQLRFAHVQHHWARESTEQPKAAQAVFGHAQRHRRIVAALQLHVDQTAVGSLAEKVQA